MRDDIFYRSEHQPCSPLRITLIQSEEFQHFESIENLIPKLKEYFENKIKNQNDGEEQEENILGFILGYGTKTKKIKHDGGHYVTIKVNNNDKHELIDSYITNTTNDLWRGKKTVTYRSNVIIVISSKNNQTEQVNEQRSSENPHSAAEESSANPHSAAEESKLQELYNEMGMFNKKETSTYLYQHDDEHCWFFSVLNAIKSIPQFWKCVDERLHWLFEDLKKGGSERSSELFVRIYNKYLQKINAVNKSNLLYNQENKFKTPTLIKAQVGETGHAFILIQQLKELGLFKNIEITEPRPYNINTPEKSASKEPVFTPVNSASKKSVDTPDSLIRKFLNLFNGSNSIKKSLFSPKREK